MTQSENEQNSSFSPLEPQQPADITLDSLPVVPPPEALMPQVQATEDEVLAYLRESQEAALDDLYPAETKDDIDGESDAEESEHHGKVMTVIEHLDELRTRILRTLVAMLCTMGVALYVGKDVIVWLEKPAGHMTFQALSLEEPVLVYFKVCLYLSVILASPFILGEFAAFIWPGLKKKEKQVLLPIVIGAPLLFVSGALFAYYLALPPMLYFFNSFGSAMTPINQRLDYYISLVLTVMMYMGVCFQLPIVLFCLSFAGIVNSTQLLKMWRYAILVSSLVAAVVTPDPTVISMLIVMAALIALYFGSVILLKLFGK